MANRESTNDELIEIARYPTTAEAAIAKHRLAEEGIPAAVYGGAMASWFSHFGSEVGGVRLLVSREQVPKAYECINAESAIVDEGDTDYGDNTPPVGAEDEDPRSAELDRAYRAALVGIVLFPPMLTFYSLYLIARHRLYVLKDDYRFIITVAVNSLILLVALIIFIAIAMPPEIPVFLPGDPLESGW